MSRPQDKLIKNSNLIQQMKMNNIRTVFNLQVKNEHSSCGDGNLKESGFSYDPKDLINSGSIYKILFIYTTDHNSFNLKFQLILHVC